jgi:SAM-dependent methyltransferase
MAAARPGNYAEQARTYDLTRGASPTVVRAVTKDLGQADGSSLLDIAGGTGNYAQVFAGLGFRVTVAEASREMLAHAARKLGPGRSVAADANALPFPDRGFDRATMIHGLHLASNPDVALAEARRVVRAGPLVVVDPTRENAPLFVQEYFGLHPPPDARPSIRDIEALLGSAGFTRVVSGSLVYTDSADGSLHALHTSALHLAGPAYLRNTSFWHTIDEETRRSGLEALARDLRSGELERRVQEHLRVAIERGHETVFAAWPSV